MRDFLDQVDFENIISLPHNNTMQILKSQPEHIFSLTGKDLMRRNVENEVHRLKFNNDIIDSATNVIWDSRLTPSQKSQFIRLADNINSNADSINRMSQIDIPQITRSSFEYNFFNGTNLYEDESLNLQSLISPCSCLGSSLSP
jgi:hypothetical protein